MSVLSAEVGAQLSQLITGLQSSDNTIRTQAEEAVESQWVDPRLDVFLMALIEFLQTPSATLADRQFAAVLFRRISTRVRKADTSDVSKELFLWLAKPSQDAIRERLLDSLTREVDQPVRNKIADAVAEIARQYSDEGITWRELLAALFTLSQSSDAGQRETAFRVFAATPTIINDAKDQEVVLGAFGKGFKDDSATVRLGAVEAFAAFFRSLTKKAQPKYYGLLPDVLNILPPLKEAGDSDDLSRALLALVELADISPKMFKPLFSNLVTFSITVVQDKELSDMTRQNALELMATFAEKSPALCKKDPSYISEMVTQCLSLMTDVGVDDEDASEWNSQEDLDQDESDSNHLAGEQCLDRLATKLGGQALLPPIFNWLPRMMTSSAWRDRHAALMAISAISEGCRDLMVGELDKVLDLVLPALRDPHPRVRWAGCNALGQMSTDFAGPMQEKFHQVALPNLIPVLESPEPRVQAHAAAALVNFCEEAEKAQLEPYLDNLLQHLLTLLQSPQRYVQEQALSTIATIADSANTAFSRYYDTLMPLLFNVLRQEQSKDYRLLRAKAMECATLIALAVGKQQMGQDAIGLVELLGRIQAGISDPDDPQASYILHCWGRMCRVLEMDFVPYMSAVMPPLLELASAKADIQLLDGEDADLDPEEGWELVPLKGKVIGIKTSTLDDKNMAIELIVIYAQVLQGSFAPYVDNIMETIAIPGLAFFFHDPVRAASAKCVPELLNACKKANGPESAQLRDLWQRTVPKVLEVLTTEPSIETLAEMYQCFYECVEVVGKNSLTAAHMQEFIKAAATVLEDLKIRVKERLDEQQGNDDGEDVDDELQYAIEDDQTLLSDMNKAFHTIFKNMGSAFLPAASVLLPVVASFAKDQDPTQRQWAICIYDDILEFTSPQESFQFSPSIMEPLVTGMRDPIAANRQAAAYGVGVAAQKGGEPWSDFVSAALPVLFQMIGRPGAREEEDVYATENACASIAKILHFAPGKVEGYQGVVEGWVGTLPVVNDEEAAPYAYSFLAQLIEQRNPAVLSKAAECFTYVAQALEAETLQGVTATRIVATTKTLIQSANLDAGSLLASLPQETQVTVRQYFG